MIKWLRWGVEGKIEWKLFEWKNYYCSSWLHKLVVDLEVRKGEKKRVLYEGFVISTN